MNRPAPEIVFLGLGGNMKGDLGGREAYLRTALEGLAGLEGVRLEQVSSLYETAPVGPQDQDKFLNAVVRVSAGIAPEHLLDRLLALELALGRRRTRRWGQRTIDLDLLLWGQRVIQTQRLTVPHPEMARRAFVLAPLAEIAPEVVHPVLGRRVSQLITSLPSLDGVTLIKEAEAWSGF